MSRLQIPYHECRLGKSDMVMEGGDATIIAIRSMVWRSMQAAKELSKENINVRVVNMYSVKPINKQSIIKSAKETGAFVTVEDHNMIGGLGSAVAEISSRFHPVPIEMVAIKDTFTESGDRTPLFTKYHLDSLNIINSVKSVINRKLKIQ